MYVTVKWVKYFHKGETRSQECPRKRPKNETRNLGLKDAKQGGEKAMEGKKEHFSKIARNVVKCSEAKIQDSW